MTTARRTDTRIVVLDGICIVHWGITSTVDDVHRVTAALVDARRAFRRPLAFVSTVHPESVLPEHAATDEYMRLSRTVESACFCLWAVLSSDSPHRQVQLGFFEAMKSFSPLATKIDDSLEDALRAAAVAIGADPEVVLQQARDRGAFDF
jgi:hypothetical protein